VHEQCCHERPARRTSLAGTTLQPPLDEDQAAKHDDEEEQHEQRWTDTQGFHGDAPLGAWETKRHGAVVRHRAAQAESSPLTLPSLLSHRSSSRLA
jgi:hypothetical protein